MNEDTRTELLAGSKDRDEVPMILEEESEEAKDRPNTCRACAGSPFC